MQRDFLSIFVLDLTLSSCKKLPDERNEKMEAATANVLYERNFLKFFC